MREDFKQGEPVMYGRELAQPKGANQLVRRLRTGGERCSDFCAALDVVLFEFIDTGLQIGEGLAMRWDYQRDIVGTDFIERGKVIAQCIDVLIPGDIGRDSGQHVIAGDKSFRVAEIETDVAGRVAWSPDQFGEPEGRVEHLSAIERGGRRQFGRDEVSIRGAFFDRVGERAGDSGFDDDVVHPGIARSSLIDKRETCQVGSMHEYGGVRRTMNLRREADVIGMEVGQKNCCYRG